MPDFATTLAVAANATQAQIQVDDAADAEGGFYVQVDSEFMLVDRGGSRVRRYPNTNTTKILWQVQRGVLGSVKATHAEDAEVTQVVPSASSADPSSIELTNSYAGTSSHQTIAADLELGAAAGNVGTNPKFLAAMMGHALGTDLTKAGAYVAGVIAALSVTGTRASEYQIGALLGVIMDGVTDADAAVVAVIDGSDPSAVTRANAAFAARINNNHADSGVDYGLDLKGAANANFTGGGVALAIAKALVRSPNDVCQLEGSGVPVDGTTGDNFAGKGSQYTDYTNGDVYIQTSAITTPVWKLVTRAA